MPWCSPEDRRAWPARPGAWGTTAIIWTGSPVPILGICAGHQFMCTHFGGSIGPALKPEFGKAALHVLEEDEIFSGLPKQFQVWESHNDEVKSLPDDFEVLARTDDCPIEAVRQRSRPLFGLQFHPEVENTEHGYEIFQNFLKVVESWKR